ncbi:hypothetical protein G7048_00610 [Diaphorobacter sp. HDW4B]|uniref:hypothetical protein n=1 Tax=Diaphorobacter sp. HDW4B TaxID=2714925 RepID=UPI00140D8E6E|nr:hypothetical protein [Diaphorobacter sp. HDW4B]QIL73310.1 hypothetical protein G7048_00610 [Diaphorobacter sp. HDW4B]
MNHPNPAIVAQSAVRPLYRWALWLLCVSYVIFGFVGRDPWRNSDVAAFGYMRELALGNTSWFAPTLAGLSPDIEGHLPYWLGAWAIRLAPSWIPMEFAARLPFIVMLGLTLAATWYSIYYLARQPGAQPVAFAFGGEAYPLDYARALGDAGLLALIASLGLAQLSHETTGYLTQLCSTALLFFAASSIPHRRGTSATLGFVGLLGLSLSGAPTVSVLLGLGSALIVSQSGQASPAKRIESGIILAMATLAAAGIAALLGLWHFNAVMPSGFKDIQSNFRLVLWFCWPAWPLALWTLWRWRRQIFTAQWNRHLLLPLWFWLVAVAAMMTSRPADRALLLGLPALAALAAFALPTLRRSIGALIDWFTLIFFSISAITIWVIWIAVQTGFPPKPAANVARLAPSFVPTFSWIEFTLALGATLAWCALVWWRASRNRDALWKSLILPASGATLGWILLMTIWLPMLDHGRSMAPQIKPLLTLIDDKSGCVGGYGLSRAQIAAISYYGDLTMVASRNADRCEWIITDSDATPPVTEVWPNAQWEEVGGVARPTDRTDRLVVLHRRER